MGFAWVQNISVGSRLDAADLNEMRTNTQTLRTALGLGAYGYTVNPIPVNRINYSIDWSQTRTALDQAYDENYCHTVCGSYMNSDNAANEGGYNGSEKASENGLYDSGEHAHDTTINGGYNNTEHTHDITVNTDDGTVDSDNGTVNAGYCSAELMGNNITAHGHDGTYYGTHNSPEDAGDYFAANEPNNGADHIPHDTADLGVGCALDNGAYHSLHYASHDVGI